MHFKNFAAISTILAENRSLTVACFFNRSGFDLNLVLVFGCLFLNFSDLNSVLALFFYLHFEILPAIRARMGTNFILVLDNCRFHNSNVTFRYLAWANVRVLAFSPILPTMNLIENIWAIQTANFSSIIFNEDQKNDQGCFLQKNDLKNGSFHQEQVACSVELCLTVSKSG